MSNPLLEQLALLYGEPKTPNPSAFLAAYDNATRANDDDTLMDAANIIARTRTVTAWPTIAECLDAIADARRRVKSRGMNLEPIENWDQWWAGVMGSIRFARTHKEISAAIDKVEPYARANWCLPSRLTEAREAGTKRLAEIQNGSDRPTRERKS